MASFWIVWVGTTSGPDRDRSWSGSATSQGMPGVPRCWQQAKKKKKKDCPIAVIVLHCCHQII